MNKKMEIKKAPRDNVPWNLLLLADPSREHVAAYVEKGECYLALLDGRTVGACVLLRTAPGTIELMNIAIDEACQGQGVGKQFIAEVVSIARHKGVRTLEVGTGNSSLAQLAFYQKAGFRIIGVERDFFVKNYPEEIVENGIRCRDMIRLAMEFSAEGTGGNH